MPIHILTSWWRSLRVLQEYWTNQRYTHAHAQARAMLGSLLQCLNCIKIKLEDWSVFFFGICSAVGSGVPSSTVLTHSRGRTHLNLLLDGEGWLCLGSRLLWGPPPWCDALHRLLSTAAHGAVSINAECACTYMHTHSETHRQTHWQTHKQS